MYETSIAYRDSQREMLRDISWLSEDIPDLSSVSEVIEPPYAITVYSGAEDESWIVEEYDEPGEKGNYGGFWHVSTLFSASAK